MMILTSSVGAGLSLNVGSNIKNILRQRCQFVNETYHIYDKCHVSTRRISLLLLSFYLYTEINKLFEQKELVEGGRK